MSGDNPIRLQDIWPIENPEAYKVHFAYWNGYKQPLDVFAYDKEEWLGWQVSWSRGRWGKRQLIFSLMQFYREKDAWLFGGIFRITNRHRDRYEVELTKRGESFIGRLKLLTPGGVGRQQAQNFENKWYANFEVAEILREPYTGEPFPGLGNIDAPFGELEATIKNERPNWKAALESIQGVYLITDTRTGKRYVGAAYSDTGIWARWSQYIKTGHGGNAGLKKLLRDRAGKQKLEYCRKNFRFSLLSNLTGAPEADIKAREKYWKDVLLTRNSRYGYNEN